MRDPRLLTQLVISKSFFYGVLLLQASLLLTCNSAATTAAWSAQPEPNFGFVFEFGACSMDKLDTFKGEFTQDRVVEPSMTIPLRLSDEQMTKIYGKMLEINLARYPEVFAIPKPLIGEVVELPPAYHYALMVENGESRTSIRWTDDIVQPTMLEADRLRELFQLIIQMVQGYPGYQQLPELKFRCI